MFSITEISVDVVSNPQKADQSFTTNPDPITSLPLLIVPAHNGIYNKFANIFNKISIKIILN